MAPNKENIIGIYHKNCIDGATAAAVLLRKFPEIKLFPLKHNYERSEIDIVARHADGAATVYIVDFSLSEEDTAELARRAKRVLNIDHHIGVNDRLKALAGKLENFEYIFDNDRSGASLAWSHFYDEGTLPKLIKYVEDNDLFKGQIGNETWHVTNYLSQFTGRPEKILRFLEDENALEEIIKKGKVIADYNDCQVAYAIENTKKVMLRIGKHIVPAYNTPEHLRSHIGKILSKKENAAVALFTFSGEYVRVHFRGNDKNNPSSLELAETLGGSGHRNAAAGRVTVRQFMDMIAPEGKG